MLCILFLAFLDTGSPLFKQKRVGKNMQPFLLVKFRTMSKDTDSVATHLVDPRAVTSLGYFLRKTKLDELPQLWNVIFGEMSLVGPRPCLFNQKELIEAREEREVFAVRPGITGLAQVQGIDMSKPELLAETDARMIQTMSLVKYCACLTMTFSRKVFRDRVKKAS